MNEDFNNVTFGWELIMNLYDCDINIISSGEKLKEYAREICKVIDMIPYGEPQIPYFGHSKPHTKGYSLLQFVETSSITGHFSEYNKNAYINIFSCKPYNKELATSFTKEFFKAKEIETVYLTRY